MRHKRSTKKFNREQGERNSLYRNLIESVVMHERIVTTMAKAKVIRPKVEKLITKARKQTVATYRDLQKDFYTTEALDKLYYDLSQRFKDRPGGYTRIVNLGPRPSDVTKMAILELVEKKDPKELKKEAKEKEKAQKAAKKEASKKDKEVKAKEDKKETKTK